MAYTTKYYAKTGTKMVHTDLTDALWSIVRWLVNDTTSTSSAASSYDAASSAGPSGPGWMIVAARSNSSLFTTRATGDITTIAAASIADGKIFTIGDGTDSIVYEFDKDNSITAGRIRVDISGDTTADDVRDTIISVINTRGSISRIVASNGGSATVDLLNRQPGTDGNVTITSDVGGGFTHSGMSGGVQGDGNGTMAGITGATNWRDGDLATGATDWCVLRSYRRGALGKTAQAKGNITPTTSPTSVTINLGTQTLTGVSGTRTSGNDDFNMTLGSVGALCTEITAAINDPANSFTTIGRATDNATYVGFELNPASYFGRLGNLQRFALGGTNTYTISPDDGTFSSGTTTEDVQLYLKMASATEIEHLIMPFDDFVGDNNNTPTFPSTAIGDALQDPVDSSTGLNVGVWIGVADEGMASLISDGGSMGAAGWLYWGDLDAPLPSDSRPFVIWDRADYCRIYDASLTEYWNRLSPADDATFIIGSIVSPFTGSPNAGLAREAAQDHLLNRLGEQPILPVGLYFGATNHRHMAGFLRNVYMIGNVSAGIRGTLGSMSYAYRMDSSVGADGVQPVVLKWDGLTKY